MTETATPAEVKAMFNDGQELALLDVREHGRFFQDGHLFFACSLPLSALELRIADLVPRPATRVVLCDGGEGLAARAAARLKEFGYAAVRVLEGGTPGWREAGYELFTGVNVPSKAFGEFIEHRCGTPSVSADELKAMLDGGENMVVLDSRPMDEFQVMNIPTAVDVPGAELAYRVHDLAPDAATTVVVNCAGRTRSIIGAQSLINAGIPNKVVALRNGTMGWHLAGHMLEHGNSRAAPEPSQQGLARALEIKGRMAARFGVREIDPPTLEQWLGEEDVTTYVLDVRHPEEFEAGHLPGSRSAPGGQLVQATDTYMATRNARAVLVDNDGVRATMTASWLLQLGWEQVQVLKDGLAGELVLKKGLETGPHKPHVPGLDGTAAEEIAPRELAGLLKNGGAVVLDLGFSRDYLRGHVPGAYFGLRSRLGEDFAKLPPATTLVLTSADGLAARLAAPEAAGLATSAAEPAAGAVKVLAGGTAAWREAGLPLEEGEGQAIAGLDEDAVLKPYEHKEGHGKGTEALMEQYLTWEVNLVEQIERDGDARFKLFPA